MNFLSRLENRYENYRIRNFTSGEFLMKFYFVTCAVLFLLGPVYRITR